MKTTPLFILRVSLCLLVRVEWTWDTLLAAITCFHLFKDQSKGRRIWSPPDGKWWAAPTTQRSLTELEQPLYSKTSGPLWLSHFLFELLSCWKYLTCLAELGLQDVWKSHFGWFLNPTPSPPKSCSSERKKTCCLGEVGSYTIQKVNFLTTQKGIAHRDISLIRAVVSSE